MEERGGRDRVSRYTIYVTPQALHEIKGLPGHMRQRIKKAIDELTDDPRPSGSKALVMPEDSEHELWRLQLDQWRVVYAITEAEHAVDVLAVCRRPPYDYGDLEALLEDLS